MPVPTMERLQDFIDDYINHPELGLKACEKKLKAKPNSALHLFALAQFQWKLGYFEESVATGYRVLNVIAVEGLDPYWVSEIQSTMVLCERALERYSHIAGSRWVNYWKQTLDNYSKHPDSNSRQNMFHAAWRDEYWDIAQLCFARLQSEFPTVTRYHFAWIALSQIQANSMPNNDKTAQTLKLLAVKSLQSAVQRTLEDKPPSNAAISARKITDHHHLRLIMYIYKQNEKFNDMLAILDSPKLGIETLGMNDGEFINCKIDCLVQLKDWTALFTYCHDKLEKLALAKESRADSNTINALLHADDWSLWFRVALAALENNCKSDSVNQLYSTIHRFLKLNPKSRNAGRIMLFMRSKQSKELLGNCLTYFDAHCAEPACFADLQEYLIQLSHDEEAIFLAHLDASAKAHNPFSGDDEFIQRDAPRWISININALRFEYFLCITKTRIPDKELLEHFVLDCLQVYQLALAVDKECGDGACILAVIGLVKLNHFSRDFDVDGEPSSASPKSYLIQAFYLLEFLRSHSTHNTSAIILAVSIAQALALTPLAAAAMHDLQIKEVQHDTVGYIFWSRISITHPHDCPKGLIDQILAAKGLVNKECFYAQPAIGSRVPVLWYNTAISQANSRLLTQFSDIPFDRLHDFAAFNDTLANSFARALTTLEGRRCLRILNYPSTNLVETLDSSFGKWRNDNRDFRLHPDFEYPDFEYPDFEYPNATDRSKEDFSRFVATRPKPMLYWLARQTVNDVLMTLTNTKSPYPPYLVSLLHENLVYLFEKESDVVCELTSSEQFVANGWDILRRIMCSHCQIDAEEFGTKDINGTVTDLTHFIADVIKSRPVIPGSPNAANVDLLPHADIIQDFFLRIEVLQSICCVMNLSSKRDIFRPSPEATVAASSTSTSGSASSQSYSNGFGANSNSRETNESKKTALRIRDAAQNAGRELIEQIRIWRQKLTETGPAVISDLLKAGVAGNDVTEVLYLDLDSDPGKSSNNPASAFNKNKPWNRMVSPELFLKAAIDALTGFELLKI